MSFLQQLARSSSRLRAIRKLSAAAALQRYARGFLRARRRAVLRQVEQSRRCGQRSFLFGAFALVLLLVLFSYISFWNGEVRTPAAQMPALPTTDDVFEGHDADEAVPHTDVEERTIVLASAFRTQHFMTAVRGILNRPAARVLQTVVPALRLKLQRHLVDAPDCLAIGPLSESEELRVRMQPALREALLHWQWPFIWSRIVQRLPARPSLSAAPVLSVSSEHNLANHFQHNPEDGRAMRDLGDGLRDIGKSLSDLGSTVCRGLMVILSWMADVKSVLSHRVGKPLIAGIGKGVVRLGLELRRFSFLAASVHVLGTRALHGGKRMKHMF